MNLNWSLALVALGATLGVMIYVSAIIAPLAFSLLPKEYNGLFIRAQFRSYYLLLGGLTAFAAVMLVETRPLAGSFSAVAAAGFLMLRQILVPQMEQARMAREREEPDGVLRFARLHRLSVVVNLLQFAAIIAAAALVAFDLYPMR